MLPLIRLKSWGPGYHQNGFAVRAIASAYFGPYFSRSPALAFSDVPVRAKSTIVGDSVQPGRNFGQGRGLAQDDSQRWVEYTTRVVLRPIASPLPLAFFAFGAASLILSGAQLGMITEQESRDLALIFGASDFPRCSCRPASLARWIRRVCRTSARLGRDLSITWSE